MTDAVMARALKHITAARLLNHITTLASDEFEGRKPGTPGEVRSTEYLIHECKKLDLGLGDWLGGYLQKMPVTGVRARATVNATNAGGSLSATPLQDFVVRSAHDRPGANLKESPVVFVGYGIVAPEYGWDDYKGVDVRGKTVVMLIGDPQKELPGEAQALDPAFFKGRALTYYGRWTYKYEIAYEKGASAVFIVHDTKKAGYGYDVVTASWGGENLFLSGDEKRTDVEGWFHQDFATNLFAFGGQDLHHLVQVAQHEDFMPVELDCRLNIEVQNSIRKFQTANVIAKIEGTHPRLKDECVIYCAHWDHFGKVVDENGIVKGIYSGAADNASGVATVLEIARAFQALPERPKRSIYFLFTTLEESGLLGARFYVQNPASLLKRTLAVLNFDSMNLWGRTRKFISIAQGHSTCDQILERYAAQQGRQVIGDLQPENGYFFRSDHLEFLRHGVPALFCLNPGDDYIDKPADYGVEKRTYYLKNDYHKFSDKVKPDWDLGGLVEDAQMMFLCGLDIANGDVRPTWNAGSEFAKVSRETTAHSPS